MLQPIASGLSPNTEADDIVLVLKLILQAWNWKDESSMAKLKEWFSKRYFTKRVYPVNAGRSALYLLLKAAGIGKGDEVLVQAFTCIGAIEPILWVGAKPVYVDIKRDTFNMDSADLARKITKRSKVVTVQHTFGIPGSIVEINKMTQHHSLILIEDCAHALGAKADAQEIGTFGDAAFFSFGRDKVVSSVFGGAAIVHQPAKFETIDAHYEKLGIPSILWTLRQLFHPIAFAVILPLYRLQLGKVMLIGLQQLGLLDAPYVKAEYDGNKPENYPRKMPPVLAKLVLNQLKKLEKFNEKRKKIAAMYGKRKEEAIYLRYPVLVDDPDSVYQEARSRGIILGRWYSNIIDPKEIDLKKFNYKKGSCPVAEEVAKKIINLPTYPRMNEKEIAKTARFIGQAVGCR